MTGCRPTAATPTPPIAEFARDGGDDRRQDGPVVAVAYSGGGDSTALLHATLAAAGPVGIRVLALHVHHRLSPNADDWLTHCERQCRRWRQEGRAIDFAHRRLRGGPAAGESVEAWARTERHTALDDMARAGGASLILLAHHRQDQAETWLLQALRGGGLAGLAAMPQAADRDGICWARPWLHRPRSELEDYLRAHRLDPIEDESNADPRYARNRLRLQVLPALREAFPQAEAALARSAEWAQQARTALAELAQIDLATVAAGGDGMALDRWRGLSVSRRSNVLRAWLVERGHLPAPASLTLRLMQELPRAHTGRWPHAAGELRLHRGVLRFVAAAHTGPAILSQTKNESRLGIDRVGLFALAGWNGSLEVRRVAEGGVPLARLAQVELKARGGAERFQAGLGRPARRLKKQFQDAGVSPWDRAGPLVFSGEQLVYVPGLGLDVRMLGLPGQPRVTLRWRADGAPEALPVAG